MNDDLVYRWADYRRLRAVWRGAEVHLTPTQAELLLFCCLQRGRRVGFGEVIEFVYPDPELEPNDASEAVRLIGHKLRAKMPGLPLYAEGGCMLFETPEQTAAGMLVVPVRTGNYRGDCRRSIVGRIPNVERKLPLVESSYAICFPGRGRLIKSNAYTAAVA